MQLSLMKNADFSFLVYFQLMASDEIIGTTDDGWCLNPKVHLLRFKSFREKKTCANEKKTVNVEVKLTFQIS